MKLTHTLRETARHLRRAASNGDTLENLALGGTIAGTALGIIGLELWGRKIGDGPGRYLPDLGIHLMDRRGTAPTVLFESGLGKPATEWSWILRALPEGIAALTYDRPGIGWSQPPNRLTRLAYPESLRAIARSLALKAPFILVGHSAGGLLIRTFAHHYPDLVGGLVFVDSSHPEQYQRSAQQQEALERLQSDLDQLILRSRLGLPIDPRWTKGVTQLPPEYHTPTIRVTNQPQVLRAVRRELHASIGEWSTEAARLTTLGRRPVAVVSAQRSVDLDPVIADLHSELAALSEVNHHIVVPDSTHESLLRTQEHAEQVAASINWVINQLNTRNNSDKGHPGDNPGDNPGDPGEPGDQPDKETHVA